MKVAAMMNRLRANVATRAASAKRTTALIGLSTIAENVAPENACAPGTITVFAISEIRSIGAGRFQMG